MNTIATAFFKPFTGLLTAFKRFPIAIFFCAIACGSLGAYYGFNYSVPVYLQLMVSAASGILLNVLVTMLLEKYTKLNPYKILMYVIGIILPGIIFLLLYIFSNNSLGLARALTILICLFIAYLLIPGHKSAYYNFDKMIFVSLRSAVVAILYSSAIGVSLCVIFAVFKNLLFQGLNNSIYGYLIVFTIFVFMLLLLSLLPKFDGQQEDKATKTARYFERIVAFIFVPLLTATTLIFLGYGAKLLITWEFPKSDFGLYSIIFLVVGIIIYLLTEPIKNDLCIFYRRFFPKVMIVVTALLGLATYFRVSEYGITENRYILIVFIIFCVSCIVIFNFLNEKNNRIAFVVFGILAIITVMPFINFKTVSNFSQSKRGEAILEKNGMLEKGILNVNSKNLQTISEDDKTQIADVVMYLSENNSQKFAKWLPIDFNMNEFSLYFGYAPKNESISSNYFYKTYVLENNTVDVNGYSLMVSPTMDQYENGNISSVFFKTEKHQYYAEIKDNNVDNKLSFVLKSDDATIYMSEMNKITDMISNDLNKHRQSPVDSENKSLTAKVPLENMSFKASAQGTDIMIVFNTINANESFDIMGSPVLNLFFDVNIFVKD